MQSLMDTPQTSTTYPQYTTSTFLPEKPYALIIDDDYAILSVIMLLLETEDYPAMGILDSRVVQPLLEQIHSQAPTSSQQLPAVILADLMMPGVSGYDITAWLTNQSWSHHIPVLIMTADPRVNSASMINGAIDYIGKPFQIDTLLDKLSPYLVVPSGTDL